MKSAVFQKTVFQPLINGLLHGDMPSFGTQKTICWKRAAKDGRKRHLMPWCGHISAMSYIFAVKQTDICPYGVVNLADAYELVGRVGTVGVAGPEFQRWKGH